MSNIIVRELPKSGNLETANLYIKNAYVFYAAVHEPKKKYQSEDREYSVVVFVNEEDKDTLLDEVMVNKTFALVGKDKTSKPPRRIKYPLSSQVEEDKQHYDLVEGLYGFSVSRPEFSKKGTPMTVNVIDKEGKTFTENVGNGSVCTLKLFGYRNEDKQLVVMLDTLQVLEHVPYEAKAGGDSVEDDVLGVSYTIRKLGSNVPSKADNQQSSAGKPAQENDDDSMYDDGIPF